MYLPQSIYKNNQTLEKWGYETHLGGMVDVVKQYQTQNGNGSNRQPE